METDRTELCTIEARKKLFLYHSAVLGSQKKKTGISGEDEKALKAKGKIKSTNRKSKTHTE